MTHEFHPDQLDNVDLWYLSLSSIIKEENSYFQWRKLKITWLHVHFSSRICSYYGLTFFVVIPLFLNFYPVQADLSYLNRTKSYTTFANRKKRKKRKFRDFTSIFLLEYVVIRYSFFCGGTCISLILPGASRFELSISYKELQR